MNFFASLSSRLAGPEIPLPQGYTALIALFPIVIFSVYGLLQKTFRDRESALVLTPGFALLTIVLSVHVCSLAARSFRAGLPIGLSLLCIALSLVTWMTPPPTLNHANAGFLRSILKVFAYSLATLVCMLPLFTVIDGHDRATGVGHFTFVSQLVNGIYPLENPFFPEQNLRYHYGIDILAATLVSLLRLRVDLALNLLTATLWIYFLQLGAFFGRRLCGDRTGMISAFVISVSAGFPVICELFLPGSHQSWLDYSETCPIGSFATNPPLVSYLFQPPFALGMTLFLFGILFFNFCEDEALQARPRRAYQAWLLIFITAPSICHVVIFLTLCGSALLTAGIRKVRCRDYRLTFLSIPVLFGVLFATRLGGFFAERSAASTAESLLAFQLGGHAREWFASLNWNLVTFGFLGPLGAIGWLKFWRKSKWPDVTLRLTLLLTGSLFVTNFVYYKTSWDIVKFATVASLSFALFSIPVFVWLRAKPHLLLGCGLVTAFSPLFFLWHFWQAAFERIQRSESAAYEWRALPPQDQDAINFLRTELRAKDLIYVRPAVSQHYLFWGGISTPWLDPNEAASHGILPERIEARVHSLTPPLNAELLIREGVTYFLLSPSDKIEGLAEMVAANRAVRVATFSPLELYRLEPRSAH